jgi:hypothetical protein
LDVEQLAEQPVQNHRIGNVRYVELIETNQPVAFRDTARQCVERISLSFQLIELPVHFTHELVKMQTRLALDRHHLEEAVHQEALAASDAAPQVKALGQLGMDNQFLERVRAARLISDPLVVTGLQPLDRPQLSLVGPVAAGLQLVSIIFGDVHLGGCAPSDHRAHAKNKGERESPCPPSP